MRMLRVHNRYRVAGGEEAVFRNEVELLREGGHEVRELQVSNDQINNASLGTSAKLALTTVWSSAGRRLVASEVSAFAPDVVHFDNTLPRISPAAYHVGSQFGLPVIQTLHNYRLMCPNGMFLRDGSPCEDCLGKTPPYPGVVHACYRNSRSQTGAVAAMLSAHRFLGTFSHHVDRYIALTEFARQKFIEGGLPSDKTVVKPNFVDAPPPERTANGSHMLFVGRLSPEKGIRTMLAAELRYGHALRIAGNGPMSDDVKKAAASRDGVRALGRLDNRSVRTEMLSARALVFPSEWYEGFPLTLVEAFAAGLPVIASRLGSMAEIVDDGVTGLQFEPGNADDLAAKIRWATEHPIEMQQMGENARREYESKYTPECNYKMLMDIYEQAIQDRRKSR